MNPNDPNVALVELVANALGSIGERLVYVGGCATGLLITDEARPVVRATQDVDLIAEISSKIDYHALSKELRQAGFKEEPDIICRWNLGTLKVDVMPTQEDILGFSNIWYSEAVNQAQKYALPSGRIINLITAPLFVATKLEAFYGRGEGDYGGSHDIEDVINLIDGRPALLQEIHQSFDHLREYLTDEFEQLLGDVSFVDKISWHFPADAFSQARVPLVIARMRQIAGL